NAGNCAEQPTSAPRLQFKPECCKHFKWQGLGAGFGLDSRTGQSCRSRRGRNAYGAKVVGQRLALLRKGLAQEAQKSGLLNAELAKPRSEAPTKRRGVDIGRGREGRW